MEDIFTSDSQNSFIFLDPPYYVQGENLYFNFYSDQNHLELSDLLKLNNDKNWFLTYDNVERIKELYGKSRYAHLPMTYTLQEKKKSKEVMFFSETLSVPKQLRMGKKSSRLNLLSA